ncbi:MAG TPA: 2,3-diaminopropionate biosynthesis protein SbnB [Methylomirabilota bacterium]|nr:2,3-diaminopropionate biosynthesis protein SbnB [Methylomirabilota bacterium]
MDDDVLVLTGGDVLALLEGRDLEVVDAVSEAYEAHAAGLTALPHSVFLTFPDRPSSRIIGLPAYVGGDLDLAGIKWVASFPANVEHGVERASAVIVLNSMDDGRPICVMEGSLVSARRTAASAVLAVRSLHGDAQFGAVAMLGCGRINFEIARFLHTTRGAGFGILALDADLERAQRFVARCQAALPGVTAAVASSAVEILRCPLVSIATTAPAPHIDDLSPCRAGATILHVSLRDIAPEAIVDCDNVVDDRDHVCRAQTSLHLAEQRRGDRSFIRCTLGEVLTGAAPARRSAEGVTVFSPFGLGILDLVVAALVYRTARERGVGLLVAGFRPPSLAV